MEITEHRSCVDRQYLPCDFKGESIVSILLLILERCCLSRFWNLAAQANLDCLSKAKN